jgi:hypothetical protein
VSGENFHRKQALCRTSSNIPQQQQQHLLPPPSLQQQQQQQQQYRLVPGQALSASTSPTNNMMPHLQQHQQQFPKSHSIDNLPREMYQQKPISYNNTQVWNQNQQQQQQQSQQQADLASPQQQAANLESVDMSLNLHKKLQVNYYHISKFMLKIY